MFIIRYTRFRNWAIDAETQLKYLTKDLKDPKFAIDVLKPEFESQISSKQKEFNWLNEVGNQLIEAESKLNPELATTTESNIKDINKSWNNLNESLYRYTVELPTTILVSLFCPISLYFVYIYIHIKLFMINCSQNTNKLFDEINTFKIWSCDLESKINQPIIFNDRSENSLKSELKNIDVSYI